MCMQDEIFGPILPIKTYKNFEETISYINDHPRPLAAYFFGKDKAEEKRFLEGTTSGGVSINDVMFHMLQKDLPFGGIGPAAWAPITGLKGSKPSATQKASTANRGVSRLPNLPALCRPMDLRPKKASDRKLKNEPCTSPGPHTDQKHFRRQQILDGRKRILRL